CHRRRGRQELVPAGCRLRFWSSDGQRSQQGRQDQRRYRGWRSPASAQHQRLLIVSVAGAKLEGSNHRPGECRRRYHQLGEAGGQKLAGLVVVISDIDALGLTTANGLVFTTAFYWDRDEASRVWSKRFFA